MPAPFPPAGRFLPLTPRHATPPCLGACRGTHAQCFESGIAPGGLSGHRVKSKQSPPYLSPRVAWSGGSAPTHTLARISLPWALPLLLFRLPNYQAEVAVWFALFLYVKYPHSPISHVHYWLGHRSFPASVTCPPTSPHMS